MKNTVSTQLVTYLGDRTDEMLSMLEIMVKMETPSLEPSTQQPLLHYLGEQLADLDLSVEIIPGEGRSGGHIHACNPANSQATQLLLGHCDTVWPVGTLKTMPWGVKNNQVSGPGAFDMKGGIVQLLFALRCLRDLGIEMRVAPVVFINSDEEIGSRESKDRIIQLAKKADRALVMEPALGLDGNLKTRRKGTGVYRFKIYGKSAHAGLAPETGASAIVELAHVVQFLDSLNDPTKGITVNVGKIDGGMRANVVAPESSAVADVRVPSDEEARMIEERLMGLKPVTPGTRIEVSGGFGRPPLEKNKRNNLLWDAAQDAARQLDFAVAEGLAGGGSDGSFTAAHTATLDGLGPVGDGAHAVHEFIYFDKMVERSALLAMLLKMPAIQSNDHMEL
ncbi:MAG: M20 family metallopeptidase [Rhodothermales bacterium]|nr:M20 family metallopeptidase [Rhodothermales bacterium]